MWEGSSGLEDGSLLSSPALCRSHPPSALEILSPPCSLASSWGSWTVPLHLVLPGTSSGKQVDRPFCLKPFHGSLLPLGQKAYSPRGLGRLAPAASSCPFRGPTFHSSHAGLCGSQSACWFTLIFPPSLRPSAFHCANHSPYIFAFHLHDRMARQRQSPPFSWQENRLEAK